MELTGNPLVDLSAPINELSESFSSTYVFDFGNGHGITQYTFWMVIILLVVTIGVIASGRKATLVPSNKLTSIVEYGYDAVCRNMGSAIGKDYKRHMPFICTLFFFILLANCIGLVPSFKTPTGSLSVTWALSLISFVYFNYWGVRAKGAWGYVKAIAPPGLPKPLVPIIWFFELISLLTRLLTLAVRLYGNMFAGHMILGVFAILTQVFVLDAIYNASLLTALPAILWLIFDVCMYALECLVAFLQAYVFAVLSAAYVGLAIANEH